MQPALHRLAAERRARGGESRAGWSAAHRVPAVSAGGLGVRARALTSRAAAAPSASRRRPAAEQRLVARARRLAPKSRQSSGRVGDGGEARGERRGVAGRDMPAGLAVGDDFRQAADGGDERAGGRTPSPRWRCGRAIPAVSTARRRCRPSDRPARDRRRRVRPRRSRPSPPPRRSARKLRSSAGFSNAPPTMRTSKRARSRRRRSGRARRAARPGP